MIVDTTDGRVALAAHVDSPAGIARAIEITFEQDALYEVVATLQVRGSSERGVVMKTKARVLTTAHSSACQ